jgi:hypothetical protein
LLAIIRKSEAGLNASAPAVLVVCPPPLLEHHGERPDFNEMFAGGYKKSLQLARLYESVAREYGARFLNAGDVIRSSAHDGLHLDLDAHAALGQAVAKAVRESSD